MGMRNHASISVKQSPDTSQVRGAEAPRQHSTVVLSILLGFKLELCSRTYISKNNRVLVHARICFLRVKIFCRVHFSFLHTRGVLGSQCTSPFRYLPQFSCMFWTATKTFQQIKYSSSKRRHLTSITQIIPKGCESSSLFYAFKLYTRYVVLKSDSPPFRRW